MQRCSLAFFFHLRNRPQDTTNRGKCYFSPRHIEKHKIAKKIEFSQVLANKTYPFCIAICIHARVQTLTFQKNYSSVEVHLLTRRDGFIL